jgi:hypothetical protein
MTHFLWFLRIRLGAALVLVIASNLSAQTITTFDVPGSTDTEPAAINAGGQVTGYYLDANLAFHGFMRDRDGTLIAIDVPDSTNTNATAINARGQITGYFLDASYATHGFLRERDGTFATFDVPDSDEGGVYWHTNETAGVAINRAGEVTGYYRQYTVPTSETRVQVFLRSSDGTFTTFGMGSGVDMRPTAINRKGQLVGTIFFYDPPGPTTAFLRKADNTVSEFSDRSGATIFKDINPAGRIVGWGRTLGSFLMQPDGTVTTFDVANSILTFPNAINVSRQITGFYINADNSLHGFLRERHGTFTTFDAPDSSYTYPTDINPAGQITGYYQDANGVHGFLR